MFLVEEKKSPNCVHTDRRYKSEDCFCLVVVSIICKVGGRDLTSDILGLMGEEILQDKSVTVTELQVLGNFINDILYLHPPPRNIITTYRIPTRVHIFSLFM